MNPIQRFLQRIFKGVHFVPQGSANKLISEFLQKEKRKVFFIQIGSNDGVSNDPLNKYIVAGKLHGVLVEPTKYLYDQLVTNHRHSKNLFFENSAITDTTGVKPFYRLRQTTDQLPEWYTQLGSFIPEVILKHKTEIPNIEDYLIIEDVNCLTFDDLLKKYNLPKVDIIHIDTEGYDYEIIKLIDFNQVNNTILLFEHKHLSVQDYELCVAYLRKFGYKLYKDGNDTIAIMPGTYN